MPLATKQSVPERKALSDELAGFIMHTLLVIFAGVPVIILLRIVLGGLFGQLGTAYNPVFWAPGVLLGFFVNRITRHRAAVWVGVVGLLGACAVMSWSVSGLQHSEYYRNLTQGHYWKYEFQEQVFA